MLTMNYKTYRNIKLCKGRGNRVLEQFRVNIMILRKIQKTLRKEKFNLMFLDVNHLETFGVDCLWRECSFLWLDLFIFSQVMFYIKKIIEACLKQLFIVYFLDKRLENEDHGQNLKTASLFISFWSPSSVQGLPCLCAQGSLLIMFWDHIICSGGIMG